MGFWQGINEGLTDILDKRQRQKELTADREARKAEIEDARAYERERTFQEQVTATIPLLIDRKNSIKAAAAERAKLGLFFEDRLSDVPEETRNAFTNLAVSDLGYSTSLVESISSIENGDLKRRMTGTEILQMADLLEKTKPDNVSLEDWTKQAAAMTVVSGNNLDVDATISALLSGDLDQQGLLKIQTDILSPTESSLGIVPDFDTSGIVGPSPSKRNEVISTITDTANISFQRDYKDITDQYNTAIQSGMEIPDGLKASYKELTRITVLPAEDRKAALFNFYAPTLIPKLAEQQPELKTYFPEYFTVNTEVVQPVPTIRYDYDENGNLVQVQQ